MQDLQSITNAGGSGGGGGGGGRIFSGGDRRLRPHPNQPLKCPRCDSLNTKFCYYNNYNLSQPRHFCKSCRRYWTKGGVLRNVPVGGGCRKAKRSNKPKPPSSHPHTNKGTIKTTAATTTVATGLVTTSSSPALVLQVPITDSSSNLDPSLMEAYHYYSSEMPLLAQHKGELKEQIQQLQQQEKAVIIMEELKMHDHDQLTAGGVDQTELSTLMPRFHGKRASVGNGELTASEWDHHGGGLLDLPSSAADDHDYWSQSQWIDHDHHLFLPP